MGHLARSCPENPRGLYPQGQFVLFVMLTLADVTIMCCLSVKVEGVRFVALLNI